MPEETEQREIPDEGDEFEAAKAPDEQDEQNSKVKIAVFYATVGTGHKAAAEALLPHPG